MKVYVAGKMTGLKENEVLEKFRTAAGMLRSRGDVVMDPSVHYDNAGFSHEEYMHVCFAMIDVCEAVYMLRDWQSSQGAREEIQYAADWGKMIIYEDDSTIEDGFPVVH